MCAAPWVSTGLLFIAIAIMAGTGPAWAIHHWKDEPSMQKKLVTSGATIVSSLVLFIVIVIFVPRACAQGQSVPQKSSSDCNFSGTNSGNYALELANER